MKVVKLTRTQLRGLIKEAIMRKPIGQPEGVWVNEGMGSGRGEEGLSAFVFVWEHDQFAAYDEGDPSMSAAGKEAWESQVEAAAEELLEKLKDALSEVETKLVDGGYHHGGGGMHEMDEDDDVKLPPMHPKSRNNGHRPADEPADRGYPGGHDDVDLPPMHPRGR